MSAEPAALPPLNWADRPPWNPGHAGHSMISMAWRAIVAELVTEEWVTFKTLLVVGVRASGMQPKRVRKLIRRGVGHEYLKQRYQNPDDYGLTVPYRRHLDSEGELVEAAGPS